MPDSPLSPQTIAHTGPDPLGVLASCAPVVAESLAVRIDAHLIPTVAETLLASAASPPAWDHEHHYRANGSAAIEQTIGWIVVLDALNFCFWGQGDDPDLRWRIAGDSGPLDGYLALAVALRNAARAGVPLWDPAWLAAVTADQLAGILRPAPGASEIPLFEQRLRNLNELGRNLPGASLTPWTDLFATTGWSAPAIARTVALRFPSFNDIAIWSPPSASDQPIEVRFQKRAQILAGDLGGSLAALDGPTILDRDQLTAFADYKVPQVLRSLGVLRYEEELAGQIERFERIAPGSREEIEIRAATIWGCELLRQELAALGASLTAADLDWLLWTAGQSLPAGTAPYHRTVTMFY